MMLKYIWILLVFIGSCQAAFAQTCSFSVTDVNFGNVNLLAGNAVDTTATLSVTCQSSLSINVRICPNINADIGGTSGSTRQMRDASQNILKYQLFQDSARTILWGTSEDATLGSPPTITFLLPVLTPTTRNVTIYGRITASQAATAGGTYSSLFSGVQTSFYYANALINLQNCSQLSSNRTPVSFNVLANVDRNCEITTQDINFGNHGFLSQPLSATGQLGITCTSGLPYTVGLGNGLNGTAPEDRKMQLGSETVLYGLYRDQNHTQHWGTGTGQISSGTGNGLSQNFTVYGLVPAQATPTPGIYNDTVIVTVTY